MEKGKSLIVSLLTRLGLIVLAAVLFAISFPNPIFARGLSFFAWVAFIPILVVINKSRLFTSALWGAVYGFIAYSLFNYWLSNFNPLAGTIVYTIYSIYLAVVFVLLKLAVIFFPKHGYLVQWLVWLGYEFLRTQGFLGYSYGISGYSQWQVIPLIQIASITGIWGVSALVTFPSFWLAKILTAKFSHGGIEPSVPRSLWYQRLHERLSQVKLFDKLSGIVWALALAASLIFGFVSISNFSSKMAAGYYPEVNIALIQHNADPWEATRVPTEWQRVEGHRRDLAVLTRLSDEALAANPDLQLVVWPETAFVPRIHWHTTYRGDQSMWLIVRDLLDYLSRQDVPFMIGNNDARRDPSRNPDALQDFRVDYNAAMLFENGVLTGLYRKKHLVPFTEHFPYRRQFPWIYQWLRNANTTFWEQGTEETVFELPDFTFSTPICFEDTFGYLSRNFVRRGADLLVNLTNDAWANSLSAQYQHLTMAVFRSVENYRSSVRSTTTGQTCAIDPLGRVIAIAEPFVETWLNVTVPITQKKTLYTHLGDYLGVFFTIAAAISLLNGAAWFTIRNLKKAREQHGHQKKDTNRR
ncbi:MAG: apolipoprotein N-acyltransferase [Treponema sp.]|nr:apolipoprotein N-acyltransferase [Treponema sp.]